MSFRLLDCPPAPAPPDDTLPGGGPRLPGAAPRVEVADGEDHVIGALHAAGYDEMATEPFGLDQRAPAEPTRVTLPRGYELHHAGEVSTDVRVEAHRRAWLPSALPYDPEHQPFVAEGATSSFDAAKLARAQQLPPYAAEHDLVITTTEGRTTTYTEHRRPDKVVVRTVTTPAGAVTTTTVAPGGTGEAKTGGNYAASLFASREAAQKGFDQVLWLDAVHRRFAAVLDTVLDEIATIQKDARETGFDPARRPRWPMIVLRTPKGWTGPKEVGGKPVEGTWRSHQVPLADVRDNPAHLRLLEQWMKSYGPDELFDEPGRLRPELAAIIGALKKQPGRNIHLSGGASLARLWAMPTPGATMDIATAQMATLINLDTGRGSSELSGPYWDASSPRGWLARS